MNSQKLYKNCKENVKVIKSIIQIILKHQWGFGKSNNNRWYIFIVLKSSAISICMDIFATKYFTTEFFKKALKIL